MTKSFLTLMSIATLISCKKEKVEGPPGANGLNGNGKTGSIVGEIFQYDEYSTTYSVSLNTTTLSIDGESNTAVTDVAGNYTLTNVQPGIYNITLTKPGCNQTKMTQISFPGNGTLYTSDFIYDKATFTFTNCFIKDTLQQVQITIACTPLSNQYRLGLVLFSKTNSIDASNPQSYEAGSIFSIQQNTTSCITSCSYPQNGEFPSGSVIYAKIYPTNTSNSSYSDYATNKFAYTGFGTPFATTFTLTMP